MASGSWTTCFSPEAEGAEGTLSMPDVEMGNQLATAFIHILPTWGGGREQRVSESRAFYKCLRKPALWQALCRCCSEGRRRGKVRRVSPVNGNPQSLGRDPMRGLSTITHSLHTQHTDPPPWILPSKPLPRTLPPETARHVCPVHTRTDALAPGAVPTAHATKRAQAEKTETPPLTPAPSRWINKSFPFLLEIPHSPPFLPPCPPMEEPGLMEPQREEMGRAWGILEAAAEDRWAP